VVEREGRRDSYFRSPDGITVRSRIGVKAHLERNGIPAHSSTVGVETLDNINIGLMVPPAPQAIETVETAKDTSTIAGRLAESVFD
jgi:hypothetical protein